MHSKMDNLTKNFLDKILLLADYLEFLGENRFKIIAYRRAVRSIEENGKNIAELYRSGELKNISGVGDAVFKKVGEIIETGKLGKLEEISATIPKNVRNMLEKLPVSGKKVRSLVDNGIDSMEKLRFAVMSKKLNEIPKLGKISIEKIEKYFQI